MTENRTAASRPFARIAIAVATTLALIAGGALVTAPAAIAAELPTPAPLLQRNADVATADPLPTVQIDSGYVWSQATVGTTVYAGGSFSNARAAGAEPGNSLTARSNLLAFNITTGELLPFAPQVNGVVRAVTASPDGTRIYIGGSFNQVNGQTRYNFAALNATTGQLISGFSPSVGGTGTYAIAATGTSVYVGGKFTQANGVARKNLAAFSSANGALLGWAPTTDQQVDAMVMEPGNQKVIAAGRFYTVNDVSGQQRGIAALDPATGATVPWAVTQTIQNGWATGSEAGKSGIFALATDATGVYGTGWTYASVTAGNIEGTFAVDAGAGALRWLADCHGDHYGVWSTGKVVYSTSHTHECDTVGLWPEQPKRQYRYVEAYTADARGILPRTPSESSIYKNWAGTPSPSAYVWYPDFLTGTSSGLGQAGLSITGAGDFISVAGEFPGVNNQRFQGIVRFATKPSTGAKQGPRLTAPAWTPSARSIAAGEVRVQIPANWDRDDMDLTYELRRDGVSTPVATVTAASTWWNQPNIALKDTGVTAGQTYTYRVTARDADNNAVQSAPTTVTVTSESASAYSTAVIDDGAAHYWPLGEATGAAGYDWAGSSDLEIRSADRNLSGPNLASPSKATRFGGSDASYAVSTTPETGSNSFTVEAWFNTTSTAGGKIVGFGNNRNGTSGSYDRHVYLSGSGRVTFGVYPNSVQTLQSDNGFNDGDWHHVAATLSGTGMTLYVDGRLVGSRSDVTSAQGYSGYWRVGGDNTNGWPEAGSSGYLAGSISDVAVYPTALGGSVIAKHWRASGRGGDAPPAPADAYGAAVYGANPSLYWRLDETAGTTANDSSSNLDRYTGTYFGGVSKQRPSALAGGAGSSVQLTPDGQTGVTGNRLVANPTTFSLETWFKTTSTDGGKLIGFGDRNTGTSSNYDRHVYMSSDGRLKFGIWNGSGADVLESSPGYNDGAWHHVVSSLSSQGMRLYVDGQLIASNGATTPQNYSGYWRVGGDTPWEGAMYWTGSLDEVAVYPVALSAEQVTSHWSLGSGQAAPNTPPSGVGFTSSVNGLSAAFVGAATDAEGDALTYRWNFGDNSTAEGREASHVFAAGGTYSVTLSVTDAKGAATSTSKDVVVSHANPVPLFQLSAQGNTVAVDASASSASDNATLSYTWDWGDGTPAGSGVSAQHVYGQDGNYTVTLTLTDSLGAGATLSKQVAVSTVAYVASDRFERSATNGWGTADNGGAWASVSGGTASVASVESGRGVLTLPAGQTRHMALQSASVRDSESNVKYSLTSEPSNGGTYVGIGARRTATSHYLVRAWHRDNGSVWLVAQSGSTVITSRAVSGLTWSAGASYQLKVSVSGASPTTLRAKIWRAGDAEPSEWQLETTDATAGLQTAGAPMLHYARGASSLASAAVRFDDFTVRDAAPPVAPPPPVNAPPVADFSSQPTDLSVAVDGSASVDPDGTIASHSWNWGDGSAPSTGATSSHQYGAAGSYDVTLTVVDNANASHSVTKRVTVTAPVAPPEPPVQTHLAKDAFDRAVTGGWGQADLGGAWTISGGNAAASVADGHGRFALTAGNTRTALLQETPLKDLRAEVDFSIDAGPETGAIYAGIVPRNNGSSYYLVQAWLRTDGKVWLVAQRGSTVLQTVSLSGLTYAAGDKFTLQVETSGSGSTELRAKLWKTGTAAPTAWQLTASDNAADLQAAGAVGMRANRSASSSTPAVVAFDRLEVTPLG